MSKLETAAADAWATGITPYGHPAEFLRNQLTHLGALPTAHLGEVADGTRVLVGGAVTHRHGPPPRAASPSSTSKTKPAWSASSAHRPHRSASAPPALAWPTNCSTS